jgi:hypothetical protein
MLRFLHSVVTSQMYFFTLAGTKFHYIRIAMLFSVCNMYRWTPNQPVMASWPVF